MRLREAILWQPDRVWRLALIALSFSLILILAYLHTLIGLTYEFHLFFAPPVALVAWFVGRSAGCAVAIVAVGFWYAADRMLGGNPSDLVALGFNTGMRLAVFCASAWLLAQLRTVLDRERRLAREDALTKLPNRRDFYERGRQVLAQAQREGTPITAVFIDLDRFKQVNDEKGHALGDALLICVADGLTARLRASDIAGRLGGDEFALLLPGMSAAAAKAYVDDLRQRLLDTMADRQWLVTFSIGVASYRRAPADLDNLLTEADDLMYEVKHGGRDRIMLRESTSP